MSSYLVSRDKDLTLKSYSPDPPPEIGLAKDFQDPMGTASCPSSNKKVPVVEEFEQNKHVPEVIRGRPKSSQSLGRDTKGIEAPVQVIELEDKVRECNMNDLGKGFRRL